MHSLSSRLRSSHPSEERVALNLSIFGLITKVHDTVWCVRHVPRQRTPGTTLVVLQRPSLVRCVFTAASAVPDTWVLAVPTRHPRLVSNLYWVVNHPVIACHMNIRVVGDDPVDVIRRSVGRHVAWYKVVDRCSSMTFKVNRLRRQAYKCMAIVSQSKQTRGDVKSRVPGHSVEGTCIRRKHGRRMPDVDNQAVHSTIIYIRSSTSATIGCSQASTFST